MLNFYRTFIKVLFLLSSFSTIVVFFLISNQKSFFPGLFLNYAWYIVLIFFIAFISLELAKNKLPQNENLILAKIEPLDSEFLPVYIGLFVIALELNGATPLENVILLAFILAFWWRMGKTFYFNPLFLFLGYRFYRAETSQQNPLILILSSKEDWRNAAIKIFEGKKFIRINNFTLLLP